MTPEEQKLKDVIWGKKRKWRHRDIKLAFNEMIEARKFKSRVKKFFRNILFFGSPPVKKGSQEEKIDLEHPRGAAE